MTFEADLEVWKLSPPLMEAPGHRPDFVESEARIQVIVTSGASVVPEVNLHVAARRLDSEADHVAARVTEMEEHIVGR